MLEEGRLSVTVLLNSNFIVRLTKFEHQESSAPESSAPRW